MSTEVRRYIVYKAPVAFENLAAVIDTFDRYVSGRQSLVFLGDQLECHLQKSGDYIMRRAVIGPELESYSDILDVEDLTYTLLPPFSSELVGRESFSIATGFEAIKAVRYCRNQ